MMSPSAWSTNQVPPALRDVRAWSSGAQAGLADQISFHTPFDRCGLMPVRATVTNNAIFRYDLHNGERSAFPHNAGPPRGPIGDVVGNRQVGCNNVANDHSLLPLIRSIWWPSFRSGSFSHKGPPKRPERDLGDQRYRHRNQREKRREDVDGWRHARLDHRIDLNGHGLRSRHDQELSRRELVERNRNAEQE